VLCIDWWFFLLLHWLLDCDDSVLLLLSLLFLLWPLAGYTLYDHKTNDSVRRELQTECILDKMNTDGTGFYTCKECHQTESIWNHITTDHKEREQLEDRRNVGEGSCNSGDGTDQRVQSLMFIMIIIFINNNNNNNNNNRVHRSF
jgi:hypothetical protein